MYNVSNKVTTIVAKMEDFSFIGRKLQIAQQKGKLLQGEQIRACI